MNKYKEKTLTNKKKILNRLAGSSAILITALGSGAGAVATQIPGMINTAFAEEVKNVTATATLEVGIQENNTYGRTDKFEINTEVKQRVREGDTVTFNMKGLNASALNGKQVVTGDGTVIGTIKTKVGLRTPNGAPYDPTVYYKDKNNLSKENKDFKQTDQEMTELTVTFNKKAEEFQNFSFKIGSNNNRTLITMGTQDRTETINIKLGEKVLVEKQNKVSAVKRVPRTGTKNTFVVTSNISSVENTEKGLSTGKLVISGFAAKDKGFKTGDKFTVTMPNDSGIKIDTNKAPKVGQVVQLSHGRSEIEDVTTVNENGVVLSQQNTIKLKIAEVSADKIVYEVVEQPNYYNEAIDIPIPVVATDVNKVDQAKNRVNIKVNTSFESKMEPSLNSTYESKDDFLPIRGVSLSSSGVKLQFKTTQWRDVETQKNLKASKVDVNTFPADKIEGYTFVRTETDAKTGNVIHYYKKIVEEKPRDDVKDIKTTRFLEEGTNKVLKPEQKGEKFLEAGTVEGYTFVKSEVKGEVTNHYFKKAEEPKKPEVPKETTTIFKEDKGDIIKTEKGTKDKEDIEGYKYIRTEKEGDDKTIHIYHKIVTRHIGTKDGKSTLLKEEAGNQPKGSFDGYEYVDTKVDSESGDVTHNYKAVEKTAEKPKTPDVKTPDKKEAVKTGAGASAMIFPLAGLGGLGLAGAVGYVVKKRKK